jgi:hypothetical protein
MIRKTTVIFFLLYAGVYYSQPLNSLSTRLDSVINAKITHKAKFIYLTGNQITVDSMVIKKVQADKKDSTILITFSDKTQKRINASELWGMITDYGERRRFYRGRSFPVWKADPPYFYRITKAGSDRYYFSETLTGDIYPLSLVSVNEHVLDPVTKNNLEIYIKENLPKNINDNEKEGDGEFFALMLNGSVNLTLFLLNILAECAK